MNNIKTIFSIKDLENLSGVKAHTIRIWEKRYNILEPDRSLTNIRMYDVTNLQKLLNVTLLNNHGYKISKISKYPPEKIPLLVQEIISQKNVKSHAVTSFKLAMMNFDQSEFLSTYDQLLSEKSFREIFYEVFIPLIEEIGLLWQSETITPAHEHFISYLIKQKILLNTAVLQTREPVYKDKVFVLFLPLNEIHELGLMYINYELLYHGYQTIFLGESVPINNLIDMKKYFGSINFVSYFTVEPNRSSANDYINEIKRKVLEENSEIWITGYGAQYIHKSNLNDKIKVFPSIKELVNTLQSV